MIDTKSHTETDHRYKSITRDQSKDTGMALVLIFLILGRFIPERAGLFHICAIAALVIDMTWPVTYKPAAWLWFGFAYIVGTLVSKLLLAIVFIFLVTPVGIVQSKLSVFHVRDHSFRPEDVEKPY
jgi:hypothetical protein